MSCIATITPASRTTTRGRLNIGSDAPIVGDCIAGLVEVGVGEVRRTVAATPRNRPKKKGVRRHELPGGPPPRRSTDANRARVGRKISHQPYRFININSSFTIYVR